MKKTIKKITKKKVFNNIKYYFLIYIFLTK